MKSAREIAKYWIRRFDGSEEFETYLKLIKETQIDALEFAKQVENSVGTWGDYVDKINAKISELKEASHD